MARHLTTVHSINVKLLHPESGIKAAKKAQPSLWPLMQRKSMECLVSELAAVDGFSIRGITNSKFIRLSFIARSYSLPKCER